MSKLVIAEKPMLARDIARAITGEKMSENARLPISGNGYTVCACAGHLLELVEPDAIDPKWGKPWNLEALPIKVHDWPKEPTEDKQSLVDEIAGLLETCDSVIAAGDPDDEGQLIVDELLDYLGYAGKVERVYVNDNIEKNIVKAFDKLVPNDSCRGAGNAAYARQMADMCFGVNETRLATKRLDGLFTVGRVQTPTLGLVVKRDEAIAHHVTRKFYELFASGDSDVAVDRRIAVFLVVEEPIVIALCKLECPLFAAPVQGADICDCGIVRHHAFLILSHAVPVAGKPSEVLILDAAFNLCHPVGHRPDAVLLVVDCVLVLPDEIASSVYRFLRAPIIRKLEIIDLLTLLPITFKVKKHLVPGYEIADFLFHVYLPFSPSRPKSRPTHCHRP